MSTVFAGEDGFLDTSHVYYGKSHFLLPIDWSLDWNWLANLPMYSASDYFNELFFDILNLCLIEFFCRSYVFFIVSILSLFLY